MRTFIESIKIIRRWVKNFIKIFRFLIKFMKKIVWKWIESKQLSFEFLRMKWVIAVQMLDVNFSKSFQFYTNASNFESELIITQHQSIFEDMLKKRTIEMFILYNAFSLFKMQRIYFIYKKKLCVLVKFVMKYDYMRKHLYNVTTIYTDHRSLIRFSKFDFHENIYEHWTDQLYRLNIDIRYISKSKNKMTDELFRIILSEDKCFLNSNIRNTLKKIQKDRS